MSASQTPGGAPEIMSEAGPFQGLSQLCLSPRWGVLLMPLSPPSREPPGPPTPNLTFPSCQEGT